MTISMLLTRTTQTLKSNAPEILTALAVSGVATTSYLVGKATYKMARDEDQPPGLSVKEQVKRHWKLYVPAGISGVVTIGCIVGASKGNNRRTAAAVTAYSLTEKAFSEYKEQVVTQIGKGKEQKIRDEVAQKTVSENPVGSREVVLTKGGDVLCCELLTRRYFRSDMETLRKAQNDVNFWVVNTRKATLDDFYSLIGLASTSVSGDLGWEDDQPMDLVFSTVMAENDEPCLAFEYNYTRPIE